MMEVDHQCARCGSSVYWEPCDECGGDGLVFDEDDDWLRRHGCGVCRGDGGWWFCLSSEAWCHTHPLPGRAGIPRGLVEEFEVSFEVAAHG